MESISTSDKDALIRDKHKGDTSANIRNDLERLSSGEPLAYVIGWIPFLGLRINLDSHPLIPRPETEWWTEELIKHINADKEEVRVLDLCAGSGAIGLAIEKYCPKAKVFFGEIDPAHLALIQENRALNELSLSREDIRESDLFESFKGESFDIIATNPPYIPEDRKLEKSVTDHEPAKALYAGNDGLSIIRKILIQAPDHLRPQGELWMECDIENVLEAKDLTVSNGATNAEIRKESYGRERILVAYY